MLSPEASTRDSYNREAVKLPGDELGEAEGAARLQQAEVARLLRGRALSAAHTACGTRQEEDKVGTA